MAILATMLLKDEPYAEPGMMWAKPTMEGMGMLGQMMTDQVISYLMALRTKSPWW